MPLPDMKPIARRTVKLLQTTICLVLLASCISEQYDHSDNLSGEGYIHLSFNIADTRASIGPDGSGSFSEGDNIGIFIDNGTSVYFRKLTLENGEWAPRLKRSDFGEGPLSVSAHYPVLTDGSATTCTIDVPVDDILFSKTVLEAGEYSKSMHFSHAMHRLDIELTGSTDGTEVLVRTLNQGRMDLLTGTAAPESDGGFIWFSPESDASGICHALIIPQPAQPYRDEGGLVKILSGNGNEAIFKAPEELSGGTPLDNFEAGRKTSVKINIKSGNEGDAEWAGRKVWIKGITPAADNDWLQLYPEFYSTLYLPWKPEYGWYDCNKRNPTADPGGIPDGNQCWAAAASNLMHWWIAQNTEYVRQYGYTGPDYTYPLPKPQESDIFQEFTDSFIDKAGYTDAGINWFIHGIKPDAPQMQYPANPGGYFKDVFPEGTKLASNYTGLSKKRFNDVIKDALNNGMGLGISIGDVRNSHAVTIWGVEFDEQGDISYIYIADNNDRDTFEKYGVGCIRLEIVYIDLPEGGDITNYRTGYLFSDKSYPVNKLVTVSLGQEYWKKYFTSI